MLGIRADGGNTLEVEVVLGNAFKNRGEGRFFAVSAAIYLARW